MSPAVLVVIILGSIILTFVAGRVLTRRMLGTSKSDQETIQRLMATGGKARATVTAAKPTGITVNNHHVQLALKFWMEPLDGPPGWEATKKVYLLQTQFPRLGDVWPAWYDRQDPTEFAVGAPSELSSEQIELYREFGIDHPMDNADR